MYTSAPAEPFNGPIVSLRMQMLGGPLVESGSLYSRKSGQKFGYDVDCDGKDGLSDDI